MKITGLLIAAFSMTGACSVALAFGDPVPQIADATPANGTPVVEEVVVEKAPSPAVSAAERLKWFDAKTFGISNLGGSLAVAAFRTLENQPHAAGPHWEGFGERYGVSLSTTAVSNAMEASVGAIWGEDPRYKRDGSGVPFKSRLGHVALWTVVAPNRDGELRPAYARFTAISGSSFISNAWRESGDTDAEHSLDRIGFGLLGRMASNAFDEFWPDLKRKLFHRGTRN